jgi:hypothetical protein
MVFEVPVRRIRSIGMQLNAGLEYLNSLLSVEIIVTDEGVDAPLEILQPVLMMTAVTASLFV